MKVGDSVRAKLGTIAALVIGDGALTGVVKTIDAMSAGGDAQMTVLMDDQVLVQSAASDWRRDTSMTVGSSTKI